MKGAKRCVNSFKIVKCPEILSIIYLKFFNLVSCFFVILKISETKHRGLRNGCGLGILGAHFHPTANQSPVMTAYLVRWIKGCHYLIDGSSALSVTVMINSTINDCH